MNVDVQRTIIHRERRRPLYVHVITRPALEDCWSVNVSSAGIGLVAKSAGAGISVEEGDELRLELTLPENDARIEAVGRVAWRRTSPGRAAGPTPYVGLGVRFEHMDTSHRLELSRFLAEFRFHVVVCGASLGQRDRLVRALGSDAQVTLPESDEELLALLAGGDVAAVVVCANQREETTPVIERYAALLTVPGGVPGEGRAAHHDLGARLVFYGPGRSRELVRLFNEQKLSHALPFTAEDDEVRAAVLDACREYGVRAEQRRTSLALARALLREQARGRPPASLRRAAAGIVAESDVMRELLELARSIAVHKVGVLLEGETGTGKEVMARALHDLSDRAHGPFVVQDCGTLTETLLDSELFGHVKGAFTGAIADHPGLFVLAHGGSVFLDEIENTTPALQAKLLRVLETGEVRPVGGTKPRKVDVRVICATNRDLALATRDGNFRSDLYYRLNAFPLALPPLRRRRDDILPLARHFLSAAERALGIRSRGFTRAAEEALRAYAWPGNVRELKNVVERALVLGKTSAALGLELLPTSVLDAVRDGAASARAGVPGEPLRSRTLEERLLDLERDLIARALRDGGGVLQRAAESLGVNRITLARKAKRYGLWPARANGSG